MATETLQIARKVKNDEFYTQLSDIERELTHYKNHFKGKTIFCNCDDPEYSNFYYYFVSNFERLGLKKLMTTHFEPRDASFSIEYKGGADINWDKETIIKRSIKLSKKTQLKQNFEQGVVDAAERSYSGDFRSPECIALLKQSDIVVTNPPFSLFREYVAQLIKYDKKFLIIGSLNAITYKETFSLIKENKIWLGVNNGPKKFGVPDKKEYEHLNIIIENGKRLTSMGNTGWFTNLDFKKRHEDIFLYKQYTPEEFPKYDNYDAIEVSKTDDIPQDYNGVMGVPISFLDKYNPNQFEIIGQTGIDVEVTKGRVYVNGKRLYSRILIKRKIV